MDTTSDTHDRIELRSEKVRKLIGEIPPSLVRWGTAIIAIVFSALLAAVCLLPYPYSNRESILGKCINRLKSKGIPFCVKCSNIFIIKFALF